jgi:hypothetical protein
MIQMLYVTTRLGQAFREIRPVNDEPRTEKKVVTMENLRGCNELLVPDDDY